MKKMSELRMSLIILLIGVFLLSGCLFTKKVTVTFKTNGGTSIDDIVLAEGKTIDEIEEPTKKGYVFDGWYIGSEKFDLDTEITEDITLVAKWKKVEIEENKEVKEDNTTTTTATKLTTTKKTTTKVVTTIAPLKATTTTTTTTTTSTTTRVTTTQAVIDIPGGEENNQTPDTPTPIVPVIPDDTESDKLIGVKETISVDNIYSYEINFDVDSSLNNVISEISEEDYRTFVESSLNDYTVENKDGRIYNLNNEVIINNNLVPITCFYIYNDTLQLTLILNPIDNKWHLDYANVQLSKTLSNHYYDTLEVALNLASDGDEIILLKDIESDTITINKLIIFNGNDKKITLNKDDTELETKYLFNIEYDNNLEQSDNIITFKNLDVDATKDSFMIINNDTALTKVKFMNSKIIYTNYAINLGNNEESLIEKDELTNISTPLII